MCFLTFLPLIILLVIFYYSLKDKITDMEESIHGRLSSIESKIDEINVILYRIGDGINSLHSTKKERRVSRSDVQPEPKRRNKTGRKRPDASAQMKARWAERKKLRAEAEQTLHRIEERLQQ